MGGSDLQNFLQHPRVQIVALCDVDANNLDKAAKQVPGARVYADWRELLQKEGDRIDSVNVAVPDHTHFSAAYSAIQRGKHVYCQKPLCHDVAEVRALTQAAVKKGVVTQLGTQVAATIHDRTGVQWLKEGRIGKVTHAYLCSNRPGAVEDYRLKGPTSDRRPGAAPVFKLGPVDRDRPDAPLRIRHLPPDQVARLAGLRNGLVGRHRLPHL
jgi:predicted dehydrogenase